MSESLPLLSCSRVRREEEDGKVRKVEASKRDRQDVDVAAAAAVQQLNHYARGLIMVQK
jgi:hypothetical protein